MQSFSAYIRSLLLVLCASVPLVAGAVVWEEPDTTNTDAPDARPAMPFTIDDMADDVDIFADIYMQPSYPDPIVDVGLREFVPAYSINPFKTNSVDFTTGEQRFFCVNLNWKWLGVGYAFPMADYTHGYDFSFSPGFSNFKLDMGISKIRNYKLDRDFLNFAPPKEEPEEEEEPQEVRLDGLETSEWHVNLEWLLNKTYFSPSSAFALSYSCGQRVSAGSMLCGVNLAQNRFKLNPSSERTEEAEEILNHLPMRDNRILNLSLGCGYGYNFVVRQGVFVVGLLFVPYVVGANANYELNSQTENHFCFGARGHGRINCAYQYRYGFIAAATNWHGTYFNDTYFSYYQSLYSVDVTFALKLGEVGIKHKKIPGNRIIDFVDQRILGHEP